MAKKTNMVSTNQIDKFIKYNTRPVKTLKYDAGDIEVVIEVNPNISATQRFWAVQQIANYVFSKEMVVTTDNGEDVTIPNAYDPALITIGFGCTLIENFTNIKSDNTDKIIELVTKTNIVNDISFILGGTASEIYDEAERLIEYRKNLSLKSEKADALYDMLINLIGKLYDIIPESTDYDIDKIIDIAGRIAGKDEKEIVKGVIDYNENNDSETGAINIRSSVDEK